MSAPRWTVVKYGFTRGELLGTKRRNGMDMALVWDLPKSGDPGATRPYPRWVPVSNLEFE